MNDMSFSCDQAILKDKKSRSSRNNHNYELDINNINISDNSQEENMVKKSP